MYTQNKQVTSICNPKTGEKKRHSWFHNDEKYQKNFQNEKGTHWLKLFLVHFAQSFIDSEIAQFIGALMLLNLLPYDGCCTNGGKVVLCHLHAAATTSW